MHSVQAFRAALPAGHRLRGGGLCTQDLPRPDSQVVRLGKGCPFVRSVCAIPWRAIGNGERRLLVVQHSSGTSSRSFSGQVHLSGTRAENHLERRTSLGQLGNHPRRPKSCASGPWGETENLLGRGKSLPVRAASQQPEEEFPEDGDYALPPLDLDELTGGRASKERAKKAKQEAADAQLLQAWDSSSVAKESLYDMLGTGASGVGMKEYTGWKPVDPSEYLAKIGIYDTDGENFPESARAAPNWDVDNLDAVWKSAGPSGQDTDFDREGTKRKRLGVKRQPSSGFETTRRKPGAMEERGEESGAASVSGRGSKPSQRQVKSAQPAREAQPGNGVRKGTRPPPRSKAARKEVEFGGTQFTASELSMKDVPAGILSDLPLESTPGFIDQLGIGLPPEKPGQEQEAWSLNQWDLGLPDHELVKEFSKQVPQTPNVSDGLESLAMLSEFSADRRQVGLEAEFEVVEVGDEGYEEGARDLALSMEELEAKARVIQEMLGARRGGVEDAAVFGGPEVRTEGGARKAPEVDDDSLLAQFDKMMERKASGLPMQPYGVRIPDKVSGKQGPERTDEEMAFWESQKGGAAELEEGDEEDLGEEDEALRRAEEVLRGKMGSGLIPQARAKLEAAEKLGVTAGEDEEEDEDEEIEEQFIQDPDWQDGWGDDMYMDIDAEIRKAKEARASKKEKEQKRTVIDLTRGEETLVGKLNQDGTISIGGRLEKVRGIENLSRGPRKKVDVEEERRKAEEWVVAVRERAEGRTNAQGKRGRAKRDTGSTWETPEMAVEREKEMAHDALEAELEAEEKLLETRHTRVMREYNLIDSLLKGEEELVHGEPGVGSDLLEKGSDGALLDLDNSDELDERFSDDGKFEDAVEDEVERSNQEAETEREKLAAEESLKMGGLWADLDDDFVPQSRADPGADFGQVASAGGTAGSKSRDEHRARSVASSSDRGPLPGLDSDSEPSNGVRGLERREAGDGSVGQDRRRVGSDDGRGLMKEAVVPPERAAGSGAPKGDAPFGYEKQTLLEQLRPLRLKQSKREEPKEETVEAVMSGYPELEFEEEVDPLTGEVRQVIRHVGIPAQEFLDEERRESERLAQSLTAERDELTEASLLVDRLLNAGARVEEMISQLGREKRLNVDILRAIDKKMGVAKKSREEQVCETLDILYRFIEAEMERQNATPALRLLDELLQLDDGTLDEATWLRMCRDRMRQEFVPESTIDIFNPPGVPRPRADGTWEYPEEEGILRIDFVREVEGLLDELEEQQREFAKNTSFTAEAIAARFVFEQKMRTAAQLRKLRRNAAMVEV